MADNRRWTDINRVWRSSSYDMINVPVVMGSVWNSGWVAVQSVVITTGKQETKILSLWTYFRNVVVNLSNCIHSDTPHIVIILYIYFHQHLKSETRCTREIWSSHDGVCEDVVGCVCRHVGCCRMCGPDDQDSMMRWYSDNGLWDWKMSHP